MNILEDIIPLCHKRHANREILRQRKTVMTPALYKRQPYHIKVHCARGNPLTVDELETADISFMPIGHATENDKVPQDNNLDRFLERQKTRSWRIREWYNSWGIQIYTGIPSSLDGSHWHDFEFKYSAICAAPEDMSTCIETLLNTHANPLLTLTKSGGLRFSCRIQDYLHANADQERFYIYKHQPTEDDSNHRVVYLEVLGDKGLSQWDMRYEILMGNLLNPPAINKEVLFAPINKLRAVLHEPASSSEDLPKTIEVQVPPIGSMNLEYAKDAFLQRGFSYLSENKDVQQWVFRGENGTVTDVSLWEDQGIVWVCASTPGTEIPTSAVAITDIWDDTGILQRKPVSEQILTIREGNLSPLAIKRPPPKPHKHQTEHKSYKSFEEQSVQLQEILTRDTRILALTTSDQGIFENTAAETYLLDNYATCLNIACQNLADVAAERYRSKKLSSVVRWRSRLYRWDQVKDIPEDIRMANPFQHGNMCENPEPCMALLKKGGNPNDCLCPKCPVYSECQERGYLSQPAAMKSAYTQISPVGKLFLQPRHSHLNQQILGNSDEHRICIIDERKTLITDLFLECGFSRKVMDAWVINWKGHALGNFAVALLNVLETHSEQYRNSIGLVRTVFEAFKEHADEIIEQMCYINIRGKVVERRNI